MLDYNHKASFAERVNEQHRRRPDRRECGKDTP